MGGIAFLSKQDKGGGWECCNSHIKNFRVYLVKIRGVGCNDKLLVISENGRYCGEKTDRICACGTKNA